MSAAEPEPGPGPGTLAERARRVSLILLDVDGVLTDGQIHISPQGQEGRSFHARDGQGIRLGQQAGLTFGLLSGRDSPAVSARAAELGIAEVHQRIADKLACFEQLCRRLERVPEEVCYVGDDLIDVPVLRRAGLAAAPADAIAEARAAAHYVTRLPGGRGAVREVIELVLRAGGRWSDAAGRYLR